MAKIRCPECGKPLAPGVPFCRCGWPQRNPAMHVASLLFDKRVFTAAQAKAWAHAHGYRYGTLEAGGPASRYWHLPQALTGRVKRIVPFGSTASGIRAIVARNPRGRSLWKDRAVHYAVQYKTGRLCGTRLGTITADPKAVTCLSCRMRLRQTNPSKQRFRYVYRPGVLDRVDPTTIVGKPIAPGSLVRVLAKRPAGGRMIAGWGRTFAWIADQHGNEQIVYRRALCK